MAAAFRPYEPLETLKSVAPDVWIVDGPEIRFSWIPFPTRMTVIRRQDGALWIHSPTTANETLMRAIAEKGDVRWLIAPNTLHYWWLPDWKRAFPDAAVYAVPGVQQSAKRALPQHEVLTDSPRPAWVGFMDQVLVTGDVLTEADFFHLASRTLVLTDLIENFEPGRAKSWLLRLLLRASGAADPDGKAPIDMRLTFLRHRQTVKRAVERMIAWAPERIILAHGRWYHENAAAELTRAFRWAL
jgi:hypothetical protein